MALPALTQLDYLLIFYIGGAALSAYSKRNKILCTFRKKDGGYDQKWVKKDVDNNVAFDGALYDVMPDRTYTRWWTGGLFNAIIPTFIKCSDYRWDSRFPLNPKDFKNDWDENPTVRRNLNKAQSIADLARGSRQSMGVGKQGILEKYQPFIMLAGFAAIMWFIMQFSKRMDSMGAAINYIQEQITRLGAR